MKYKLYKDFGMKHTANKHGITWNQWLDAINKQPIDNSLKFEDIINNTIITAKRDYLNN